MFSRKMDFLLFFSVAKKDNGGFAVGKSLYKKCRRQVRVGGRGIVVYIGTERCLKDNVQTFELDQILIRADWIEYQMKYYGEK